jgi:hypothetical protein
MLEEVQELVEMKFINPKTYMSPELSGSQPALEALLDFLGKRRVMSTCIT